MHALLFLQPPPSSLAAPVRSFVWVGDAKLDTAPTLRILTREQFVLVQQAWAVQLPLFDRVLDAYRAAMAKLTRRKRVPLKHWKLPLSLQRRWGAGDFEMASRMLKMSRKCQVYHEYIAVLAI